MCDLVCADQLPHPLFDDIGLGLLYLALQLETLESHGSDFCFGLRVTLEQLGDMFQKFLDCRQGG